MDIFQGISTALLVVILGLGWKMDRMREEHTATKLMYLKEIKILTDENNTLKAKEAVCQANAEVYLSTIADLKRDIHSYKIDTARKDRELDEYKSKPDGEKYKKMYDRLAQIKETQDDCKRYEDTSNAFNGFNLNNL